MASWDPVLSLMVSKTETAMEVGAKPSSRGCLMMFEQLGGWPVLDLLGTEDPASVATILAGHQFVSSQGQLVTAHPADLMM